MRWEELTGEDFAEAVVKAGGVCVVPVSCLEHHAHHLPLGTDMYVARELAERATALEPAVVFPDLYLGQILEGRHMPGAVGLDVELLLRLLEGICQEVARNGLDKIVLVNGHGGNDHLLKTFVQSQLTTRRDYVVVLAEPRVGEVGQRALDTSFEAALDGHAGEKETSAMLVVKPDLVHLDRIPEEGEGYPTGEYSALAEAGAFTAIWFYADHPTHHCGDSTPGTVAKGELWLDTMARGVASLIATVRTSDLRAIQDRFFDSTGL